MRRVSDWGFTILGDRELGDVSLPEETRSRIATYSCTGCALHNCWGTRQRHCALCREVHPLVCIQWLSLTLR